MRKHDTVKVIILAVWMLNNLHKLMSGNFDDSFFFLFFLLCKWLENKYKDGERYLWRVVSSSSHFPPLSIRKKHWRLFEFVCLFVYLLIYVPFKNISLTLILTTVHTVYLIWKKGSRRVWSIDRGCLHLHGTWSHLWYIQRSVYAHSLICISYWTYDIEYCSLFLSFHVDVTITGEGLQHLGLYSVLRAFEQGGIFIVSHLLWHGALDFRSHPKDHPIQWYISKTLVRFRCCRYRQYSDDIVSTWTTDF
jgi:hypothetical protein